MRFRLTIREKGELKMVPLPASDWRRLAQTILDTNKKRIARGINLDGVPALPLSPRYARIKAKKRRQSKPIRDLKLTGELMMSYQVVRAHGGIIRAEPRSARGRKKAWATNLKEPMMGFTDMEERAVMKEVRALVGRQAILTFEKRRR